MSDDFGTVGTKRGERSRDIDVLRQHYRTHRDTLMRLISDAPSEHLASEYQRLVAEIDSSVRKLDELEGRPSSGVNADTNPLLRTKTHPGKTAPGNRPLVRPEEPMAVLPGNPQSRVALILIAGVVVLVLIGYLIWRASSQRKPTTTPIVEQPPITSTANPATAPPTIATPTLTVVPALADYGTIRKGTRAVRQFEVTNPTGSPIELQVARSACRCLFYDYKGKLAPNGKETITVTIDGARAKAGPLQERVEVTAKGDPSVNATFTVQATIR